MEKIIQLVVILTLLISCKGEKEKVLIGKWYGTNTFSCGKAVFPYEGSATYEFTADGICFAKENGPIAADRTYYYKIKGDSISFSGNQDPKAVLTSTLKIISPTQISIVQKSDTCEQTLKLNKMSN